MRDYKDLLIDGVTFTMELANRLRGGGMMSQEAYRFFLDTALNLVDQGYQVLGEERPGVGVIRKVPRKREPMRSG